MQARAIWVEVRREPLVGGRPLRFHTPSNRGLARCSTPVSVIPSKDQLRAAKGLLLDAVRSHVWLLDGLERESGEAMRILYAGAELQKNYIAHLAFGDECDCRSLGVATPISLRRFARRNPHEASLMVVDGHPFHRWLYGARGDFWIPRWIRFVGDAPLVATNRSAKEDLRRLRKSSLTYSVTTTSDRLREFYHSMYLPTVTTRHGNRAVEMGLHRMLDRLRQGTCELLQVLKADEAIAGVLIAYEEGRPRLWSNGILNGDPVHLKERVVPASYYFASLHLAEQGFDSMDIGSTRAFFSDGVMAYKTKWKVRAQVDALRGFLFKPLAPARALDSLLAAHPMVTLEKGEPRAAVFRSTAQDLSMREREQLGDDYGLEGLAGVDIYQTGGVPRGCPVKVVTDE